MPMTDQSELAVAAILWAVLVLGYGKTMQGTGARYARGAHYHVLLLVASLLGLAVVFLPIFAWVTFVLPVAYQPN